MRRFFAIVAMALVVVSCNKSEEEANQPTLKTITASTTDTRTWMDTDGNHFWASGDAICVGDGSSNTTFTLTDGANTGIGTFTGLSTAKGGYAVFPASGNTVSAAGQFSVTFPASQTFTAENFKAGSYASRANVLVATGDDASGYSFKNAGGFLGIKLMGDAGVLVRDIIIESASTIAGGATVTYDGDVEAMTTQMAAGGSTKLTLNCFTNELVGGVQSVRGVELNPTTPIMFVVALPAVTMEGMTIRVMMTNDTYIEKSTAKSITIKRNVLTPMSALYVQNVVSGGDTGSGEGGEGGEGGETGGETGGDNTGGTDTPTPPAAEDVVDVSNTLWYIVAEGDEPIDPSHVKIGENTYAYPLSDGEEITTMTEDMFPRGSQVSVVVIPSTVTDIENKTFNNLVDGFSIYIRSMTPPDLGNMPAIKNSGVATVYVPAGTLYLYEQDADWRKCINHGLQILEYTEVEGA